MSVIISLFKAARICNNEIATRNFQILKHSVKISLIIDRGEILKRVQDDSMAVSQNDKIFLAMTIFYLLINLK